MTVMPHLNSTPQENTDHILNTIERYQILNEIGRGGMAVVYLAKDLRLDRKVAIKILHHHLLSNQKARARFHREAQAVARLKHPTIIEIYDFAEEHEGLSYLVTEYIEGQTLKTFINQHQAFFPELAIMLGIKICDAIEHAHNLNVIHRDLKPDNIMVSNTGKLKLMDFGIAKVIDHSQQMTQTGTILGSPAHMAPELFEGKELDFRSDLFSLGTILYWLATGRLPFSGQNPHQVIKQIVHGNFPDPERICPVISINTSNLLRKALHLLPENRFQTASIMKTSMQHCLSDLDLDDIDEELADFFINPAAYLSNLRNRLSERLLERSKVSRKLGEHDKALQDLNRVLALNPKHPQATPLIQGIRRQRRIRFVWTSILCVLLATLLVVIAVKFGIPQEGHGVAHEQIDHIIAPDLTDDIGNLLDIQIEDPLFSTGDLNKYQTEAIDPAPIDAVTQHPQPIQENQKKPQPSKPPVQHPVKILIDPYFDLITVDNTHVFRNNRSNMYGQLFSGKLKAGKHTIKIERKGCYNDEFQLVVSKSTSRPIELRRRLHFQPASLVVQTSLDNVMIWVDSIFKGSASDTKTDPIEIFMEGYPGARKVALLLVDSHLGELSKYLLVKAGEEFTIPVSASDFSPKQRANQKSNGTQQ